ncbi:unnamed protein product, partial [Symbiodinium pilosum]
VAVTSRPKPDTQPPAYVMTLLLVGRWAFPLALWCGVGTWAAAPTLRRWESAERLRWIPRILVLDYGEDDRLFATLCMTMVLAALPVVLHLVHGANSANLWTSLLPVLSAAMPLMCLKLEFVCLKSCWARFWPPTEDLLAVETHVPWVVATLAMNTSFIVNYSLWLLAGRMAVWIAPVMNRKRIIQQQDADSIMFTALEAAAAVAAILHCPMILRSLLAAAGREPAGEEDVQVEKWSRVGAMAIFAASTCLLWFACWGASCSMSVVLSWSVSVILLANRLGASSCLKCLDFAIACSRSLLADMHLTMFQQSLRAGDITFTSREQQTPAQPLLSSEGA